VAGGCKCSVGGGGWWLVDVNVLLVAVAGGWWGPVGPSLG
jgi:hypothetical protein